MYTKKYAAATRIAGYKILAVAPLNLTGVLAPVAPLWLRPCFDVQIEMTDPWTFLHFTDL